MSKIQNRHLSLAVILALTICFNGCIFVKCAGFGGVVGNGIVKTIHKELPAFREISIDGVGSLEIKIGEKSSVSVSADENLLPYLRTDVKSDRLVIHQEKSINAQHGPRYLVTTPNLTLIRATGATSVEASLINSEKLKVSESGVGSMSLSGTVGDLEVELSGAGSVYAYALKAQNVDASVSGVGSLKVSAEKQLKAKVSGTGSIRYRGTPAVESHVSGVGSVSHE